MALDQVGCTLALSTLLEALQKNDFLVRGGGFRRNEDDFVLTATVDVREKNRQHLLPLTHEGIAVEYTFAGEEILK